MGLRSFSRDPFVRAAADDGGNVAGAEKRVDAHVGRIENRADGGNDGDVVAEYREIADALGRARAASVSAVEGAVVSNPMAKNITCRSGLSSAIFSASAGE